MGFNNTFRVSSIGNFGGLCLFWREDVAFSLLSYSKNHICGDVSLDGKGKWRFVGIYGWPNHAKKCNTWRGDFNETLRYEEKEGGADKVRRGIEEFRDTLDECSLKDLGYNGCCFTWERGTQLRLGSVKGWTDLSCPPIEGFKFETCWLLDDNCEAVVKEAWCTTSVMGVLGKIQQVARHLKRWSSEKFDAIGKQIEIIEMALKAAQGKPISHESCAECARLERGSLSYEKFDH
ncbi:Transcription factor PCF7 [Bienertia sinuspersici]